MRNSSQTRGAAADGRRAKALRGKNRRRTITAYLFLLPYLALLAVFGVIPVGYAVGLSFFDSVSGGFTGLLNYRLALDDFRLGQSFVNVITFVSIWVSLMIVGVVTLAAIIDVMPRRLGIAVRTVYFLPGAVTSAAIVVLWLFILDPQVSPFKLIYGAVGWENRFQVIDAIGLAGVFALMAFFAYAGGWIVVLHGALTALPGEVMEAARIDGCRPFKLALRIKIPMIWRSIALMAILSIANGLQLFVEPQLLGLAGPQLARNDWSLNQLAYQYAFALGDFGVSAALSTMILALSISIALWIVFATKFYRID